MRKTSCLFFFLFCLLFSQAQEANTLTKSIIAGQVLHDSTGVPLPAATVRLSGLDNKFEEVRMAGADGAFSFTGMTQGWYRLTVTNAGFNDLTLDSIHVRPERLDFNLNELRMKTSGASLMPEVVVYAEKPLFESSEGNITFNAGESTLSATSNASELLTQVPLVTKDPDGKVLVRGKEPRILIDDKPVELNLQQVQDLLESMPGSTIEKIEVMTNPPPQYANEEGGVINIVTKRGTVGINGRVSLTSGTRGSHNLNGSYNYRKKGLSYTIVAGASMGNYNGGGYSIRNNIYTDSSNFFNTEYSSQNRSVRPNFRASLNYDISKNQSVNVSVNFNKNHSDNDNDTWYRNINRFGDLYRLSRRVTGSVTDNFNPSVSAGYNIRGKRNDVLKLTGNLAKTGSNNNRDFLQEYYYPDGRPTGEDSLQQQNNNTRVLSFGLRANYSYPLANKKTFFNIGSYFSRSNNHVLSDAGYIKEPAGDLVPIESLSRDFLFHQSIANGMVSVKQRFAKSFSATAGLAVEKTTIWFELRKENRDVRNGNTVFLPFGNLSVYWKETWNATLSYRRTVRRPGVNELNPTVDISDPYTIRFGNEKLEASTSDNFDLVIGKSKKGYFFNLGAGYNAVNNIFSQVRTLLEDGKTQVTWENISGRKEYEMSSWNSYTLAKKIRLNLSATYVYSRYSEFDKKTRRFRDGGSFSSNAGLHLSVGELTSFTGSFNLNRFSNPQGYANWNSSMNFGVQRRLFKKKISVTASIVDPFSNQQRRTYTYGPNFNYESYRKTLTRNVRIGIAYNFRKQQRQPLPFKKS